MNKSNHQRKLLIVPILHTQEDMGSLGSRLPAADGYAPMASKFWKEVEERIKKYVNGFKKVKVYQDGLPDANEEIVGRILNEVKSPNYELLRYLKDEGAKIFGTENPELLKEEYKFVSQADKDEEKAACLLIKRDSYIAKRIDKTLKQGDFGILFLGAAHQIQNKLPKDIQVEIL